MKSAEGRRPSALNRAYSSVPELYDTPASPARFRRRVLSWYRRSGRDLPWRHTRDPYRVLVSEVMLQQTQVSRVRPAYRRFLTRFPTLRALSRAALGAVLREWSGLGYNRRARDLHRIARRHSSALPRTVAGLDALPGVGAYTASAVACFAFGEPGAFADTNIRRVLGRAVIGRIATDREAVALDARFGSRREPARWHHALMDIGATICFAKRPRCDACPIRPICEYDGVERSLPRKQSPFGASDRRVRGAIVRNLATATRDVTIDALRRGINDARVPRLVRILAREGLGTCSVFRSPSQTARSRSSVPRWTPLSRRSSIPRNARPTTRSWRRRRRTGRPTVRRTRPTRSATRGTADSGSPAADSSPRRRTRSHRAPTFWPGDRSSSAASSWCVACSGTSRSRAERVRRAIWRCSAA
ncbi:MAG: A/G-specific adenine glycosylase [Chloroflexi bacterium]|nr:MAG: A/G-specific adenine glycosylase [Chloroflexota bacterium]